MNGEAAESFLEASPDLWISPASFSQLLTLLFILNGLGLGFLSKIAIGAELGIGLSTDTRPRAV